MRSGVCSPQLAPAPRPESRLSGHSGPGPATASRAAPPAVRSARGQPLRAGRRLRGLGDGEGAGCPREDKMRKGERAGRRPAAPRLQPAVRDVPDAGVCWGAAGPRLARGSTVCGGQRQLAEGPERQGLWPELGGCAAHQLGPAAGVWLRRHTEVTLPESPDRPCSKPPLPLDRAPGLPERPHGVRDEGIRRGRRVPAGPLRVPRTG